MYDYDLTADAFEHCLSPEFRKMRYRITPERFEAILAQLSNNCDHYTDADRRVMLSRLATAIGGERPSPSADISTFAQLIPGTKFITLPDDSPSFGGRGYYVFEKLDSQLAVRIATDDEHKMKPDTKVLTVYA